MIDMADETTQKLCRQYSVRIDWPDGDVEIGSPQPRSDVELAVRVYNGGDKPGTASVVVRTVGPWEICV